MHLLASIGIRFSLIFRRQNNEFGKVVDPAPDFTRRSPSSTIRKSDIGPYRISKQVPKFADVTPFARALVESAPDCCVWGTDWLHSTVSYMPNDGDLADMLADWVPDEVQRNKILAANPARRYDF